MSAESGAAGTPPQEDVVERTRAVAETLVHEVTRATVWFAARDAAEAAPRPAPETWAPVEIVGHLIDSAVNNLRRFVLVQGEGPHTFEGYAQDAWVARQRYAEADWGEVVTLWGALNIHLARVIDVLPASVLHTECQVGSATVTVAFLAEDYLAHLRHHLRQLGWT